MKYLIPRRLSQEAFAPFGDVIQVDDANNHFSINQGFTERFHDLAKVDVLAENGRPGISIFRSTPLSAPVEIRLMERHPLSSQAFIPMGDSPYLVVVAPPGELIPDEIQVFTATANQGVNYHAGTWHHFCLALNHVSDFLVIDRLGEGKNCDEMALEHSFLIQI